jgi:hypothetical protein
VVGADYGSNSKNFSTVCSRPYKPSCILPFQVISLRQLTGFSYTEKRKNPWLASSQGFVLVEAAGQLIHLFRDGLDYAFIPVVGMRGVLSIAKR